MFARIFVSLLLLFPIPNLPNGIRLVEFPQDGDSAEIVAGYSSGGLTALSSTNAARSLNLTTYSAGGRFEFFEDSDRTGFRITVAKWAVPMFTDPLDALFKEIPKEKQESPQRNDDFRAKVEEEIRSALLGYIPQVQEYATDRAFVLMPGPIPTSLENSLAAIPRRPSKAEPETLVTRLPAERTLRFKSELAAGAVIFASPIPGMYYKGWYSVLFLDRLIHRVMPFSVATSLPLTLNGRYYRLEVPVPAGQFPEPVEENLLQEIQRMQFTRAAERDLLAARQEALAYLDSKYVREWFASHGIPERREEGVQWIQAMTADDMRVAARELLIMNRVIATWAPKARQTSVEVESLSTETRAPSPAPAVEGVPMPVQGSGDPPIPLADFPNHSHMPQGAGLPEKLASGVSLAASNTHAVFISGGDLTRLDREPDAETLKAFQSYAAARILVLAPEASLDRARQLWSSFNGNPSLEVVVPKGNVAMVDLPALFILKIILDRKLIEAGWWHDVELRINASDGSGLQIRADAEKKASLLKWIKQIASEKPSDTAMAWAREVAIHRFDTVRADLQALIWERDPLGTVQDLQTIGAGHVQDVARIYF